MTLTKLEASRNMRDNFRNNDSSDWILKFHLQQLFESLIPLDARIREVQALNNMDMNTDNPNSSWKLKKFFNVNNQPFFPTYRFWLMGGKDLSRELAYFQKRRKSNKHYYCYCSQISKKNEIKNRRIVSVCVVVT